MSTTTVHFTRDLEKLRSCKQIQKAGESYVQEFLAEGAGKPVKVLLPPKDKPEGRLGGEPCQSKWFWEIVPESEFASGTGHYVCEHLIDCD